MTNPNTYPTAVMVYGGAPSFDEPATPNPFAVIADLRAGLDAAKRLREHLPGDAPELRQADDTIAALEAAIDAAAVASYHAAPSEFDAADELATLRADNDARGELIERLRAERDQARMYLADANRRNEALAAELDTVRSERDAALNERNAARSERDAVREELTDVMIKLDRNQTYLDHARRDRDKYFAAYQRTLRALTAALGEP